LHQSGNPEAAVTALRQAVSSNPYNARAVADLANALTARNEAAAALELCSGFLHEHPAERLVIAAHALALLNAGQAEAARALTDCKGLIKVHDLPCPAGFSTLNEFNATLAQTIRDDPSLLANPASKSTYGGAQTGEIDLNSTPALRAFAVLIQQAVKEAVTEWQTAGLQDHPVLLPASPDWSLRTWGTVLRAGGRQTPHMHPLGWLSGVYYVQLPAAMTERSAESGWLEFGQPPPRFVCRTQPDVQRIEPLPGRLLLFPSWLWHQTLPFDADGERISIAFDVMPRTALRLL